MNFVSVYSHTKNLEQNAPLDEITSFKVHDACTAAPQRIKAVGQNSEGYIIYFFGYLQLTCELIFFIINMIYLHPS